MPLRRVDGLSQEQGRRDSKTGFSKVGAGANISPFAKKRRNTAAGKALILFYKISGLSR
jgi:hypothetical protein